MSLSPCLPVFHGYSCVTPWYISYKRPTQRTAFSRGPRVCPLVFSASRRRTSTNPSPTYTHIHTLTVFLSLFPLVLYVPLRPPCLLPRPFGGWVHGDFGIKKRWNGQALGLVEWTGANERTGGLRRTGGCVSGVIEYSEIFPSRGPPLFTDPAMQASIVYDYGLTPRLTEREGLPRRVWGRCQIMAH